MKLEADNPWTYLRGIEPSSFCDWPGRISAVLFFGTCNLRCPTCHNAELAWHPERLPLISRERLTGFLNARGKWLDGVVFSGGEPSQVPGLGIVLDFVRSQGLDCKLDTNGCYPEVVESFLSRGLVQQVAVDVKGPWSKYPELTGQRCTAEEARRNLGRIFELAESFPGTFHFRCTKVPLLTPEDLELAASYPPEGFELSFQEYIPPKGGSSLSPATSANQGGSDVHGGF
jgi:pyruvate formate lyase activating enzyme